MGSTRFLHFMSRILGIFAAITLLAIAASAGTAQVIYGFAGDDDGEYTDTDLVIDNAGNIYGSSVLGGAFGSGTVFQLAPSGGSWTHTVLYSFTGGKDGGEPYKGVTLDSLGNLYGTTVTGGGGSCEGGCGVAFKLTNSGGTWTYSTIHTFTGGMDGSGPGAGLTFDKQGNLYGMTPTGGASGLGTIYQLRPQQDGSWRLKVLHAFTGGGDGSSGSAGRLLLDGSGTTLYGVATTGGGFQKGTAFKLTQGPSGKWSFKTIYTFKGQPDAGFPYGGLLLDAAGHLYGTTYHDGANNLGCVYELSPSNGAWKERVLYSFRGGKDGKNSISNLVFDKAGNLYGTTSEGGLGYGTIFKLARKGNQWKESVAYRFAGAPDASLAYSGMAVDLNGNMYGATVHGGNSDDGTIYQFTP